MRVDDRQLRIDEHVNVDERLTPDATSPQLVPRPDSGGTADRSFDRLQIGPGQTPFRELVQHPNQRPPAGGDDHHPDHQPGQVVCVAEPERGADPAGEDGDRRERIGSVMPGVRLKGGAAELPRNARRPTVHPFFDPDGESGHDDNGDPGEALLPPNEGIDALPRDEDADENQRRRDGSSREGLESPVTVRVVFVGRAPCEVHPAEDGEVGRHVGSGVDPVCDQARGSGQQAHNELGGEEDDIPEDTEKRDAITGIATES